MTPIETESGLNPQIQGTESEANPSEGLLEPRLRDEILAGYLDYLGTKGYEHPHHYDLTDSVEGVLLDLFETPNLKSMLVSSSTARFLTRGINNRYWSVMRYLMAEQDQYTKSTALTEQFFSHPLSFAIGPDMDVMVKGSSVNELAETLMTRHSVSSDEISTEPFTVHGKTYEHNKFSKPLNDHTSVAVSWGPIRSVPSINIMIVEIRDRKTDGLLYHFDIGEAPSTGSTVERDKRQAKTTRWQDECQVELVKEGNRIKYSISPAARQALTEPDEIKTESPDPDDFAEIFLRSVRMQTFHELPPVRLPDGTTLALPKLDMFLPSFTAKENLNLFHLRHLIIESQLYDGVVQNEFTRHLLTKELAVSLTNDPYLTIQALRDSGLAVMIPGLKNITRDQWNKILTSRRFVVEPISTKDSERTFEFMEKQRREYLKPNGREPAGEHYNGLNRFISTLHDLHIIPPYEDHWSAYLELWHDGTEHSEVMPLVRRYQIESDREIRNALSIIREHSHGTRLGKDITELNDLESMSLLRNLSEHELHRKQTLTDKLQSLALGYTILKHFPSGLTPREIKNAYSVVDTSFQKVSDFGDVLLDLKVLGLVQRHNQPRIHQRGHLETVSFYTVRQSLLPNKLSRYLQTGEFRDFLQVNYHVPVWQAQSGQDALYLSDMIVMWMQDLLLSLRVPTFEALQTLGLKDYERLTDDIEDPGCATSPSYWKTVTNAVLNIIREYSESSRRSQG